MGYVMMPIDNVKCEAYWAEFINSLSTEDPRKQIKPDAFGFGGNGEFADELAALVLAGKKKATASLPIEYTSIAETLPRPGDMSIILDGAVEPVAIIERTSVHLGPFQDVEANFAADEIPLL